MRFVSSANVFVYTEFPFCKYTTNFRYEIDDCVLYSFSYLYKIISLKYAKVVNTRNVPSFSWRVSRGEETTTHRGVEPTFGHILKLTTRMPFSNTKPQPARYPRSSSSTANSAVSRPRVLSASSSMATPRTCWRNSPWSSPSKPRNC